MTDTTTPTAASPTTAAADGVTARDRATIAWLESQFPGWTVHLDQTDTGDQVLRPLWIATRDGHHPQAELSASKLHTRLSDYLDREDARKALMN